MIVNIPALYQTMTNDREVVRGKSPRNRHLVRGVRPMKLLECFDWFNDSIVLDRVTVI